MLQRRGMDSKCAYLRCALQTSASPRGLYSKVRVLSRTFDKVPFFFFSFLLWCLRLSMEFMHGFVFILCV